MINVKSTLLAFMVFAFCTPVIGQLHYKWSQTLGGSESDFGGRLLADDEDNLYTVNRFHDTVDVDPGPGTDIVFPKSSAAFMLLKSNAESEYLWGGRFYSAGTIGGHLLEVKNDQVRLIVQFTDSLEYVLHGQTLLQHAAPGPNVALLRLSLDGAVIDAVYMDASNNFFVDDLHTLSTGYTIMNGSFRDTLTFPGTPSLISNGSDDSFFALLNPAGDVVWSMSFGSSRSDYTGPMSSHDESIFYFSVAFRDTLSLNTLEGPVTYPASGSDISIVAAINLQGQITHTFPVGNGIGEVYTMTTDRDGHVYVAGYVEGTFNFAHQTQPPVWHTVAFDSEGFIARYTHTGLLEWVNVYPNGDYGGFGEMVLARDSELYVSGSTTGRTDLDPGPDSLIVEAGSRSDIILTKLNLDGEPLFVYHFEGNEVEGITNIIVSESRSEVIISGFYYDTLDVDFTDGQILFASNGGTDIFRIGFDEENVITAIADEHTADHILVFPNPANDVLHISSDMAIDAVTIQSINGQHVRSVEFQQALSGEMDLRDLTPGIYCVSLFSKDKLVTKRIVVQ